MSLELTDAQRDIIQKVEKLLRLAGKNTNEAEAASATEKAMALLSAHNLDLGVVEREGGDGGKRQKEELAGGFYQFQQDLWHAVAQLNFCWYWRSWKWEKKIKTHKYGDGSTYARTYHTKRFYNYLVGRQVNVVSTKILATYLLGVADRLCRDRLGEREGTTEPRVLNSQMLGAWAISYREGVVDRLVEKLEDRRREVLSNEREVARAAAKMAMQGASTATGLTLAAYSKSEQDANADFMYGEGWSASVAADRAQRAMWRRMDEAERTAWAAENQEEAARQAALDRDAAAAPRRRGGWGAGPAAREKVWSAYKEGFAAGDGVGIDQQASSSRPKGALS